MSDQTEPDRVIAHNENYGNRRGCCFRRQRRTGATCRGDHRNLPAKQIGRQFWQPLRFILGPAILDRHVLTLDKA
jgi:hypothetical protein